MTPTQYAVRDMHSLAASSKEEIVNALQRRGISLREAQELADQLSANPVAHRTACDRIRLEYRAI